MALPQAITSVILDIWGRVPSTDPEKRQNNPRADCGHSTEEEEHSH